MRNVHPLVAMAALSVAIPLAERILATPTVTTHVAAAAQPLPPTATVETPLPVDTGLPITTPTVAPEPVVATVQPTPAVAYGPVDDSYTKDGLLAEAEKRGVTVKKSWKKQQIIDAINANVGADKPPYVPEDSQTNDGFHVLR